MARQVPLGVLLMGVCLPSIPSCIALTGLLAGFVETVIPSTSSPIIRGTALAVAPDGRIFVCEQVGRVRIVKNGVLLPTPLATLPISSSSGELGLRAIAIDPTFAAAIPQYIYVQYTGVNAAGAQRNKVSRLTMSEANPDLALAASELAIFTFPDPIASVNHNTASMHFGPDGFLYVGQGDGDAYSSIGTMNAQSMTSLYGKILRFNKDGTIPVDNPFYTTTTGQYRSIFALGFRNRIAFSFARSGGTMYISNVGGTNWEEVNKLTISSASTGKNFGYAVCDGSCPVLNQDYMDPLYAYAHTGVVTSLQAGTNPRGCATIGSAYYDPAVVSFPAALVGKYFFTDACSLRIMYINPDSVTQPLMSTLFATHLVAPRELIIDPTNGSLLYLTFGTTVASPSTLGRISYTPILPSPSGSSASAQPSQSVSASTLPSQSASASAQPSQSVSASGLPSQSAPASALPSQSASVSLSSSASGQPSPSASPSGSAMSSSNGPSTLLASINFGSALTPAVIGYIRDRGLTYKAQNGQSYGWSADVTALALYRTTTITADVRYKSLVSLRYADALRTWEFAVPSTGAYLVTLAAGDSLFYGGTIDVLVEDTQGPKGKQLSSPSSARWITWTGTVQITDGRLTLRRGPTASSFRPCWITIIKV